MGEVIEGSKMTSVPLNGRNFIDLLALQPGVSPYQGHDQMTNGIGIDPATVSGDQTNGTQSVNGGRTGSNGFMVNGADARRRRPQRSGDSFRISTRSPNFASSPIISTPNTETSAAARSMSSPSPEQSVSWKPVRISPQHRLRRRQLLKSRGTRRFHPESVWWNLRRADKERQSFLFWRLPGKQTNPRPVTKLYRSFCETHGDRSEECSRPIYPGSSTVAAPPEQWVSSPGWTTLGAVPWATTLSNELGYSVMAGEPYYYPGMHSDPIRAVRLPERGHST